MHAEKRCALELNEMLLHAEDRPVHVAPGVLFASLLGVETSIFKR